MTEKHKRLLARIAFLSALILASSFFLPVAQRSWYVDADGQPVGLLGQLFPQQGVQQATTREFFWEDMSWLVPAVFFGPLLCTLLARRTRGTIRAVLVAGTPLAAVFLAVPLYAIISMADFDPLFGLGGHRLAFGAYIAATASVAFIVASSFLAAAELVQRRRTTTRYALAHPD